MWLVDSKVVDGEVSHSNIYLKMWDKYKAEIS